MLLHTLAALFMSLFVIVKAQSDCKVIISEINVVDPMKPEKKEFIELKSSCNNLALRGYKLIGLNTKKVSGTIDLVVTLWNERTNNDGFFTVGGSEVLNADLKVPNDYIRFRSSFNKNAVVSVTNFMKNGIKDLRAIGLLYDSEKLNPFSEFTLSKTQTYIRIDDFLLEILKKYLIDLVVYGERVSCDKSEVFEKIHNDFALKTYMLREFSSNTAKEDISLNRCAVELAGFLPEKFKLGSTTPGKENDCSGPHFILEDHILETISPVNERIIYEDEFDDLEGASCSNMPMCTSSIDKTDYMRGTLHAIQQTIETMNVTSTSDICSPLMLNPDGGNIEMSLNQENNRKRSIGVDHDYSEDLEWESTKYFRDAWIDQIKNHQKDLIPVDVVQDNKVWFEYLFNEQDPTKSTYRCRLCFKHYDEFHLQQKYKSPLASEEGTLKKTKSENRRAISEHSKNVGHKTVIQILEEKSSKR